MNVGKYIVSNLIGTVIVALIGLLVGFVLSLIAGLFLPESFKPYIIAGVFIMVMLGVPGIWVSNWRQMKALEFLEAAESQDEYAPSFSPSSLTPSALETESHFDGLQWCLDNRLEYDALKEEYKELSNTRLFYDISGPVSNYISRENENLFMGKPLSDVLVIANGYAIFWPKVFDRPSSRYIPQPVDFSLSEGTLVHAWWDGDGFHCELI